MKKITKKDLQTIRALIREGYREEYWPEFESNLSFKASSGRSNKLEDLNQDEASKLISELTEYSVLIDLRREIYALACQVGFINENEPYLVRLKSIDCFLLSRGTVKKKLFELNKSELQRTIGQFKKIEASLEERKAGKMVKALLKELNITVK